MNLLKQINNVASIANVANKLLSSSITILLLMLSTHTQAEDIELYISNGETNASIRPQVLIIFDTSGSMQSNTVGEEEDSPTRLAVAKESVINLIESSPNVDFGLQVFNRNDVGFRSGGRIVSGIQQLDDTSELTNIIRDLNGKGFTPLCESLYEASLYFSGGAIDFGNDDPFRAPGRDRTIESEGRYITPLSPCLERAYVILITDGAPTRDAGANNKVKALSETLSNDDAFSYSLSGSSFLPALAGWMNNNDVNIDIAGIQKIVTHTIGFSEGVSLSAQLLLEETARRGGGSFVSAEDGTSLTAALQGFITAISSGNNSLTSASVAPNNFDRTETLDSVYYAVFEPELGPRWHGNLKKYKVVNDIQQGVNGVAAINETTGGFSELVKSYWSTSVDGNLVSEGGVAEMLRNKPLRKIYTNIGRNNALKPLTYNAIVTESATNSESFNTTNKIINALNDVPSETPVDESDHEAEINNSLDWVHGFDVDNENTDTDTDTDTDKRLDIFGDPLHSKPVVINYGNDNIYIVVGTNHGVLHMFKDNGATVDEQWAFMPTDFLSNINKLRDNNSSNKIYGIDGAITTHIVDNNGNGTVDDDDKVWVFFGLRRGGSQYYAMDITNIEKPEIKWIIKNGDAGFNRLGQTWSQPKVIHSPLNIVDSKAAPVLVFGGGYDTSKDAGGVGGEDDEGNAIYMVDAATGTLKWSLSPGANTSINTAFNGKDSIPSSIATLDSDGDGLTDRLYAGDTGGNVWRIDMPGSVVNDVSVFKLANLGKGDSTFEGSNLNTIDRRFFNEPSIVRAYITETITTSTDTGINIIQQDVPYDAILIGSGDRSNPLGTDTQDVFFMIKDPHISTRTFSSESTPALPIDPIEIADLQDYTDNPFLSTFGMDREVLSLEVSSLSGWYINLEQGEGEKSSSSALVINNIVYFTTYTPPEDDLNICTIANGRGFLYAVDLSLGIGRFNEGNRSTYISDDFLDTPTLIINREIHDTPVPDPETGLDTEEVRTTFSSTGSIIVGQKIIDAPLMPQTTRTYLYIEED